MTHAEVEAVLVFDKKKLSLSLRRNKRGIIYLTLQVRISFNQDLSEAGPSLARGLQSLSGRVLPTSPQKTCATYHADDSDNNDAESLAHKSKGGSDDSEVSSIASSSQEEELIASETELYAPFRLMTMTTMTTA